MKYIIKLDKGCYYIGSGYKLNGNKHAAITVKNLAKRYSTHAKAEHTKNRLIRTCVNATNAEIEEVDE